MYCINCGIKLSENMKYCPKCGCEVEKLGVSTEIKNEINYSRQEGKSEELNYVTEDREKIIESDNDTPAHRIMEMWKKLDRERKAVSIFLCVTIVAILLLAIYCGNRNQLVGSWSNGNGTTVFDSNGNFTMDGDMGSGTYEVSGTQLTLTTDRGSQHTYTFSIENDVLTITYASGKTEVMYRDEN